VVSSFVIIFNRLDRSENPLMMCVKESKKRKRITDIYSRLWQHYKSTLSVDMNKCRDRERVLSHDKGTIA
jgi:hypothetical protein